MVMAKIMRAEIETEGSLQVSDPGGTKPSGGSRMDPGGEKIPLGQAGEGPISIIFGAAERHDFPSGDVYRPEAVHSETCDPISKACTACDSNTACWHGVDPNALQINVPAGVSINEKKEHLAIIWASCSSASGSWKVYVEEEVNAKLLVYLNGEPAKRTPAWDPLIGNGPEPLYAFTSAEIGQNAHIKIVLLPNDPSETGLPQASSARVTVKAIANQWVDTCMDRNLCLNRLGRGAAGFELRNNNQKQYECLRGKPATHLSDVCGVWRACFASQSDGANHEAELLTYLSVVFGKAKAPKKASKKASNTKNLLAVSSSPEEGCTDPAAEDAEAIECECLEELTTDCAAAGVTDTEECFLTALCHHPSICPAWKNEHCGDGSSLLERRSIMTSKANGTLDGSVTGKCTSETQ